MSENKKEQFEFDFEPFEVNFDCEKAFSDYFMESEYQHTTIPDDDDKNKWQIVITLDDEESCKNLKEPSFDILLF